MSVKDKRKFLRESAFLSSSQGNCSGWKWKRRRFRGICEEIDLIPPQTAAVRREKEMRGFGQKKNMLEIVRLKIGDICSDCQILPWDGSLSLTNIFGPLQWKIDLKIVRLEFRNCLESSQIRNCVENSQIRNWRYLSERPLGEQSDYCQLPSPCLAPLHRIIIKSFA